MAAHTLDKLQNNVSLALVSYPLKHSVSWGDSLTVLCWLVDRGEWSTFVRNRVRKIQELSSSNWKYVPSAENPSDLGTRGAPPDKLGSLWFTGPSWLSDKSKRPQQAEIIETSEVQGEKKPEKQRQVLLLAGEAIEMKTRQEWAESLLNKYNYWKTLRITAYMVRFMDGCRLHHEK